jgi:ATP-dependent helicase/nuclease subunit A
MNERAPLPHETDLNQARASDPEASAWASANAGTGKTEVLVKRVLRLLIAGSKPECILCLTYTKTAAAEMQNRLLKELAVWATAPEDDLREELRALMRRAPEEGNIRTARRLFARALEARGGLKIHTIHGFCERLLQRFPLEAQVTPHFKVLDERGQAEMRRLAFDTAITRAAEERESTLGKALAKVIALTSEDYFRNVVDTALGKRAELAAMMAYHDARPDWAEAERLALRRLLGVEADQEDALTGELAAVLTDGEIDALLEALALHADTADDDRLKSSLAAAKGVGGEARASLFRTIFCTDKHEPRQRFCSRALKDAVPALCAALEEARNRFVALDLKLAHLRVAEASTAVLAFADAIQADYERRKRAEAVLDYDDLIVKTSNLLSRADAAAWVLYKIDGGVDHILVDEAQDTNPQQWTIIERLAEEFFAGEGAGANGKPRTLFAVGDEKQSIYSFQGADPARFGQVGRAFRRRAEAAGLTWHEVPLNLSFRSTEPILDAVDHVFAKTQAAQGLKTVETTVIKHQGNRKGEAGLVEVWETETETKPEPAEAFEPWNEEAAGARSVDQLCRRIAWQIKRWLDDGEPLPSQGRKVKAGDILILVRRRDPFITPMIRALKREGVHVAGADRMRLMDQLAVQDLVALADVLLMPEDDLALAVVLKSPLFGLDDGTLFDLAYDRRPRSLWSQLRDKAKEDARFSEPWTRLSAWLARADYLPPYEFFAELLGAEGQLMRKRMLTRLGPEAAEAIDEFLDLALAYDRDAAPSLQGFIDRLRTNDIEIKRDMEQDRDEVRIMTVHGAKGLQAPIVFLPDTCMLPRPQGPRLFPMPRPGASPGEVGHLIWPPAGHSDLDALSEAKARLQQAEREEYHRLLYVAMTRACDRLYICGWQGQRNKPENECWYELIKDGLAGHLLEIASADGISVRRMESAQAKAVSPQEAEKMEKEAAPLPDWALAPAKPERGRRRLAPSRLALGPDGGPQETGEQPPLGPRALSEGGRYARGLLVHALLQHLPEVTPEAQERAARAFVAARGANSDQKLKDEIIAETLAIVREPSFAALFQPGSLAEVPVVARIGEDESAAEIEGQIDRLAVLEGELLILDYKTNLPPPSRLEDVAPTYIRQLAAYRLALKKLFPGRTLRAALLWTDGPRLMEIPSTSLDAAERSLSTGDRSLDAVGAHT